MAREIAVATGRVRQAAAAGRGKALMAAVVCAALLGGCGASLTDPTVTAATPGEQKIGAVPSTGATGATKTAAAAKSPVRANTRSLNKEVAKFTAAATPGNVAYKIGPEDVLDVSVFKVPELTRSVQVAGTGTVNLPLVGEIQAAGKTAQQVERDLTKLLGAKYLQSPQVTVFVKEYNSQRVTIEGGVKKPGVYPLRGGTSLLQFVAMAGGLEETTSSEDIVIIRQAGGKRSAARFDIDAIRNGTAKDPLLVAGDVVVANTSAGKVAFQNFLKVLPSARVFVPFL